MITTTLITRSASMAALAALGLTIASGTAHAFGGDSNTCYATAPLWNAPNGAIIGIWSDGPIATVLNAVGEQRTHSMISHGAIEWKGNVGWASHSTTLVPSASGSTSIPVRANELAIGYPGMEAVNMGGAYGYLRSASMVHFQIPGANSSTSGCTGICRATGTTDWVWYQMPYSDSGLFALYGYNDNIGVFNHFSYGFHQYMDGRHKVAGWELEDFTERGIVCSQAPAYAYEHWAIQHSTVVGSEERQIKPQAYNHDKTVAAGKALFNTIFQQCFSGIGVWQMGILTGLALFNAGPSPATVCARAAAQVLNCFFQGERSDSGCNNTSLASWNEYAALDAVVAGALSLSPDALLGWSGHPTSGATVGPWAPWGDSMLQWNGGGSTYGCWN